MLLIPCPYCGLRSETEFRCHGEVGVARSKVIDGSDAQFLDYICVQSSKRGPVEEYWHHEKGCGEWFRLTRDTVTHEYFPPAKTGFDE